MISEDVKNFFGKFGYVEFCKKRKSGSRPLSGWHKTYRPSWNEREFDYRAKLKNN